MFLLFSYTEHSATKCCLVSGAAEQSLHVLAKTLYLLAGCRPMCRLTVYISAELSYCHLHCSVLTLVNVYVDLLVFTRIVGTL